MRHCWAPLQSAYDDMQALYAEAATQVERLFPNKATHVPDGNVIDAGLRKG